LGRLERPAPANGKAAKTGDKPAKKGAATTRGRGRAGREIQPPSWRRVRNRALIFAPVMFVVVWLLGGAKVSPAGKLIETVFLLGFFLPFSYAVDALAYRSYRKRLARD